MAKVKKRNKDALVRKVLLKDIVIPKGTVLQRALDITERHGAGHFSCVIGLSQNTAGSFEYCIDDDLVEMSEYFVDINKYNELSNRLRHELQLGSEVKDEDILKITKRSFVLARIELGMACANLKKEMVKVVKNSWLWQYINIQRKR